MKHITPDNLEAAYDFMERALADAQFPKIVGLHSVELAFKKHHYVLRLDAIVGNKDDIEKPRIFSVTHAFSPMQIPYFHETLRMAGRELIYGLNKEMRS